MICYSYFNPKIKQLNFPASINPIRLLSVLFNIYYLSFVINILKNENKASE